MPLGLTPLCISKATGTFLKCRNAGGKGTSLCAWMSEILGSHCGWRCQWIPGCSCFSRREWHGPRNTLSRIPGMDRGFRRCCPHPQQGPGILCWSPAQDRALAGLAAACSEAGIEFGKGQGDLEVLEKGLIIPIAPEEREVQEDDLSLVDCLRRLRGSSDTSTPFLSRGDKFSFPFTEMQSSSFTAVIRTMSFVKQPGSEPFEVLYSKTIADEMTKPTPAEHQPDRYQTLNKLMCRESRFTSPFPCQQLARSYRGFL